VTLDKHGLRRWEESAHLLFTPQQERLILEAYGTESEYGWTEQDISEGVRKILRDHPAPQPRLPDCLKTKD
jgi:hypothetical protein